jgi:eukaryotic-like serine/threonine-protein kinase
VAEFARSEQLMALGHGTRLGPYEVVAAIGAGGMGEVYRARDTRLDRTVAIKILPSAVAGDPTFRERFDREARTVAALNHPHICTLHDIGEENGTAFLVMEYLEGETLADRLGKGGLPIEHALRYAVQIAEALDKAHRSGIVHRDLKPGNIMLTKSGGAKLLDFGLAKTAPAGALSSLSVLPTAHSPVTAQGTILGTLQYMAPEQVEGRETDTRSDIFAFGAIVYEMVTGKRAFDGKSQATVIAAILDREPPAMSSLRPLTPNTLDHIVQRCLAKEPDDRWQTATDLLHELRWLTTAGAVLNTGVAPATGLVRRSRERLQRLLLALTAVVIVLLAIPALRHFREAQPALAITRLDVVTPPTTEPFGFALAPDGRQLVFVANGDNGSELWLRRFDQVGAQALPGTLGGTYPFWSPDSRSVAFFADAKLKRLDVAGGAVQTIADATAGRGGTWNRAGIIVFSPSGNDVLMRVSAAGGSMMPAMKRQTPSTSAYGLFPQFLPDGNRFLFLGGAPMGIYIGAIDGNEPTRLLQADTAALFAPPDQLLLVRQGVLMAQHFDPDQGSAVGDAMPIAQSVGASTVGANRSAAFSLSDVTIVQNWQAALKK